MNTNYQFLNYFQWQSAQILVIGQYWRSVKVYKVNSQFRKMRHVHLADCLSKAKMRTNFHLFTFHLLIVSLLSLGNAADTWKNHVILDTKGDFQAFWDWDDVNITIEVQVRTKGWVGFGFSPNGGMVGADIVMGWVKDHQLHFQDRYAPESKEPLIDPKQDYELLSGSENETHTILRFRRTFDTCDDNDMPIKNGTMKMIYAWNPEDPVNETGMKSHGKYNKGSKSVLIFDRNDNGVNFTDDVFYWDAQTYNLTVPQVSTAYLCRYVKYPGSGTKRHRVGMEMIFHPADENAIHHVSLYECKGGSEDFESKLDDYPFDCYELESLSSCPTPELVWDLGRQYETLPLKVGVPFGEIGKPSYFIVQTHYNNPELRDDIRAQATMRVYLTEKLRQYEAGAIYVQVRPDYNTVIPPKQPAFILSSNYPSEFTKFLPAEGISVFGLLFHAHSSAHRMRARHFRDSVELPLLGEDNNFDTEYQQRTNLMPEAKILPGDSIRGECEFNTMDRTNLTLGGLKSVDEMCRITLYYYPASDVALCRNNKAPEGLFNIFKIEELWPDNLHIKLPAQLNNMSVPDYFYNFAASTLTEEDVRNIQDIQLHGKLNFSCWGDEISLGSYIVDQRKITNSPYVPPPRNC